MKRSLILLLGSCLAEIVLGWTYHHNHNKKAMNWTQARQWCQTTYTDMVVIQSQEENDYLVSKLPNRTKSPYYWIGITKNHKNETWTWIGNNSTWIGENSWAENEPNNNHSTEFCVEIYVRIGANRGKWNDEKCGSEKYPVCYKAQCNATSCGRGRCQETMENITCLCEPGFEGDRCQTQTAKCNATSCGRGRCQETMGNITCLCEPGFEGDRCQTETAKCNATSCGRGRCQETMGNITCLCEPGFEGDRCQTETAKCNATSCGRGRCQETTGNITCFCDPGFKGDRCQTAVLCPPLSQPDNGHLSCSGGNQTFNSTCRFKCYSGFLIIGSPAVTCGVTGVWSGPRPACASYKQALLAVAGCGACSALCCFCFCWMKRRKRKKVAQVREPEEVTSEAQA